MEFDLHQLDARDAKGSRVQTRSLGRLCALLWPHRGALAFGAVLTVIFAGLNTVGIGGVFPVIKVLLEPEGLHAWIDRWVVSQRVGASFAPPDAVDGSVARVVAVERGGPAATSGLQPADEVGTADGSPIAGWFRTVARAAPDAEVPAHVTSPRTSDVVLRAAPAGFTSRLALWAVSLVPESAGRGNVRTLGFLLGGLVVVVVLANVFRYLGEVVVAAAVLKAMINLREKLYERTLGLPIGFHLSRPTADLVTRFVQDVHEIQRGLLTLFGRCIREPLRAVLFLALALTLDWRVTLALLVTAPLVVLVFWAIGGAVKRANRKLLERFGLMLGTLTNSLQNIRVVKAHNAEPHEMRRLVAIDHRMYRQQLRLAKLEAATGPLIESLGVIAGSVMTVWLASRVLSHELSMSTFLTIGVVLSVLFDPLRKLSDVYVKVVRSTAGAERIFQVIDQPVERERHDGTVTLTELRRAIEFADVSFTYPGAPVPALRDINLTIAQGETVAIVGPNGSGKTTLVNMLPRFFDPSHGTIRYDGVKLDEATLSSLRQQFGVVSQESVVFGGTPLENIAYGAPEVDVARATLAAEKASADAFISALPGGYEATLGDRGTTLSGGQRQRLAIARAIYRSAPILIFDEATSQVDSESELAIHRALTEFSVGRTTVIIAHRLSTIQFAKRIVVMESGRIVDIGSHRELFQRCSLYRTLCETQLVGDAASGPIAGNAVAPQPTTV